MTSQVQRLGIVGLVWAAIYLPALGSFEIKGEEGRRILAAIAMQENGNYVVPVKINIAITLRFVVDSGAADVSIPLDVFSTLVRTGTLQDEDLIGKKTYKLADGSTVSLPTFRIRSLILGSWEIENVTGSVAPDWNRAILNTVTESPASAAQRKAG